MILNWLYLQIGILYDIFFGFFLEAMIVMMSELLLRSLYYGQNRSDKRDMLVMQEMILLVSTVLISYFHHITYLLIFVTVIIFFKIMKMREVEPMDYRAVSKRIGYGPPTVSYAEQPYFQAPLSDVFYNRLENRTNRTERNERAYAPVERNGPRSRIPHKREIELSRPRLSHDLGVTARSPLEHSYNKTNSTVPSSQGILGFQHKLNVMEEADDTYYDSHDHELPSMTPPGIINEGNTCFVNSILQCLTWTPGFLRLLPKCSNSCKNDSSVMLCTLNDVFRSCSSLPDGKTKMNSISISQLLSCMSFLAPHLVAPPNKTHHQQDAAEFLLWLLDYIHGAIKVQSRGRSKLLLSDASMEEARKNRQLCMNEITELGSGNLEKLLQPMMDLSELDWSLHLQEDSSSVYDLFLGQIMEARECRNCKKVTISLEYFTLLPIPIPANSIEIELANCFDKFGEVEYLDQDNMVSCSCVHGDSLMPATRLALLSVVPQCLVLQLTRFSYDSMLNSALKKTTPVYFPENINMFQHTMQAKFDSAKKSSLLYRLYAFCVHSGALSTSYGHYVAYCRASDEKWYVFNDHHVELVEDIEPVLKDRFILNNAYLLFYHRVV